MYIYHYKNSDPRVRQPNLETCHSRQHSIYGNCVHTYSVRYAIALYVFCTNGRLQLENIT